MIKNILLSAGGLGNAGGSGPTGELVLDVPFTDSTMIDKTGNYVFSSAVAPVYDSEKGIRFTTTQYLTGVGSKTIDLSGDIDFAISVQAMYDSVSVARHQVLYFTRNAADTADVNSVHLRYPSKKLYIVDRGTYTAANPLLVGSSIPLAGATYEYVFQRKNGVFEEYCNGVLENTRTVAGLNYSFKNFLLNPEAKNARDQFVGYMKNLKVYRGGTIY